MWHKIKRLIKRTFKTKRTKKVSSNGNYLIEFRFQGYAKKYAKELSADISRKFHVMKVARRGKPPHITLYGPFKTNNEKEVLLKFIKICKSFDLIKFKLKGFSHIENRVVQLDVEPSEELKELRSQFAKELNPICQSQDWDEPEKDFIFHATLAFRDIEGKFNQIWGYLQSLEKPDIDQYLLRVTLLKNRKILREYDLIQRNNLRRNEALSRQVFLRTVELLKEIKENKGERKNIELTEEAKLNRNIFFISDLHLDHSNIIKFTNRPFKNVNQMNDVIVNNWNSTVTDKDKVYFLGDMAFGKGSRKTSYWLEKLNGNTVFIEGNHEEVGNTESYSSAYNVVLKYKGKKFLLVHDPALKPKEWNDWIIHGHKHNNDLVNYPLINKRNKTINVSAELLAYKPINFNEIMKLMETKP
ncbi:MAG: 2'-5' RNA ligase family protein [archaeon]